ncbi:MAG: hypothetical protein U5N85_22270 [Arcicella sp.]|nr:hypothetical protein [Arcicella sp.]
MQNFQGGSPCSESVAAMAGGAVAGAIFGGGFGTFIAISFSVAGVWQNCR